MGEKKTTAEESYIPKMYPISEIIEQTADTRLFRINYGADHKPGQFVELSLLGIGECPISICSDSQSHIDLCIRRVGSVTGKLFEQGKKQKIGLRGPYGNGYPMQHFEGKHMILIGGGTGVAPLRGVIHYIENNKSKYPQVSLFLGFRTPEDILFSDEIRRWKRSFYTKLTVDQRSKGWRGRVGVITGPIDETHLDPKNAEVLICGPPVMIKFVKQSLFKKGFSKKQIWLSLERDMQCGIGKCGHCMINNKYVCKDGPVFNLADIDDIKGE